MTQDKTKNTQYELIDTHAHLTLGKMAEDVDGVLRRSCDAGVSSWITVGTNTKENQQVAELAAKYEKLYAAVGIHPHDAKDVSEADLAELELLAGRDKVAALGEMGLDFHYDFSPRQVQKDIFAKQLELAAKLNMPVIIHSREAFDETIEILDEFRGRVDKVVFHCFGGDADQARFIIEQGWYISFTGVVTFKNAHTTREAARAVPLDRMMVETDCPYMSPEPMRKQKDNEPALMVHTARFLAELKNVSFDEFARVTTATARQFFELKQQKPPA